jgi:nucleoside-diphosphate-sugar epimerase
VEDVAAAVALAALDRRAVDATYNVGEADAVTEREWIEAVAAAAGRRIEVTVDPGVAPSRPARWEIPLVTDNGRMRAELGFHPPVGRSEGLRRSVVSTP